MVEDGLGLELEEQSLLLQEELPVAVRPKRAKRLKVMTKHLFSTLCTDIATATAKQHICFAWLMLLCRFGHIVTTHTLCGFNICLLFEQ